MLSTEVCYMQRCDSVWSLFPDTVYFSILLYRARFPGNDKILAKFPETKKFPEKSQPSIIMLILTFKYLKICALTIEILSYFWSIVSGLSLCVQSLLVCLRFNSLCVPCSCHTAAPREPSGLISRALQKLLIIINYYYYLCNQFNVVHNVHNHITRSHTSNTLIVPKCNLQRELFL